MTTHVTKIAIKQFGPYLAVVDQNGHTLTAAIPLDQLSFAEEEQIAWCVALDLEMSAIVPFDALTLKEPNANAR